MSQKYLTNPKTQKLTKVSLIIIAVFGSFWVTSLILRLIIWILIQLGVPLGSINLNILNSVVALIAYIITLVVFVFVLGKLRIKLTNTQKAMSRMPTWTDLILAPLGFLIYLLLSVALTLVATFVIPGFDATQAQDVGFSNLTGPYEALAAFVTLVILAPVAEEILFRGYLLGALKLYLRSWQVVLITALIFAFMHGSLNVGVDTFALGIILAVLRLSSGSLWASILLHMMKNSLAFYLIFINPSILHTMV